jgi:hypothetical protein
MKFKDLIDALEHYGAEIGTDIGLVKDAAEHNGVLDVDSLQLGQPDYEKYKAVAREQYLSVCFLPGADHAKYGSLVLELENDYTKGTNHVPATVAAAYELMNQIKLPQRNQQNQRQNPGGNSGTVAGSHQKDKDKDDAEVHGVVFVNKNGKPVGKDVSCFACGSNHYKGDPDCPKNKLTLMTIICLLLIVV